MPILEALGLGASIFGSILGHNRSRSAQRQAAAQAQADRQFQMDMAKNQIQWRVADAKAAGIHPLYAMGPTGMSYSPPAVVGGDDGSYLNEMGQNVSRAFMAMADRKERREIMRREVMEAERRSIQEAVQRERESVLFDQTVRRNELELQYMGSRLALLNAPGTAQAPDAPVGAVTHRADDVTVGSPGAPERAPGVLTDYSFGRTASGGYRIIPSDDMKQRIEDMPSEWQWWLSNGLVPHSSVYQELERRDPAGPGYQWNYDALRGEFRRERVGAPGRRLYDFFIRPDLRRR